MKRICMALLAAAILTAGCSASPPTAAPAPPAASVASAAPEMFRGVPVLPGAQPARGPSTNGNQLYFIDGTNWEQVRDWYLDQMPAYGWGLAKCAGGPAEGEAYRSTFGGNDGRTATITLVTQTRYTELRIITADPQGGAKCGG